MTAWKNKLENYNNASSNLSKGSHKMIIMESFLFKYDHFKMKEFISQKH